MVFLILISILILAITLLISKNKICNPVVLFNGMWLVSFILYKIILHIHFKEKTSATKLCKSIISRYDEDNLDHNFIMYYFYLIHENKAMRMKYLNQCKSLIDKSSCIIDNRFLFKLWNKECSTDKQAAQFKDTLMNYIFKSFN